MIKVSIFGVSQLGRKKLVYDSFYLDRLCCSCEYDDFNDKEYGCRNHDCPIHKIERDSNVVFEVGIPRTCSNCGKTFVIKEHGQTKCFDCLPSEEAEHLLNKPIEKETKICVWCGSIFLSNYPFQKYCKDECRLEAIKNDKREKYHSIHTNSRRYKENKFVTKIPNEEKIVGYCQLCGSPIKGRKRKYCKEECRLEDINLKKKENYRQRKGGTVKKYRERNTCEKK